MIALIVPAYIGAGFLIGGLVVRDILPKAERGRPSRKMTDRERVLFGLVGLCSAAAWPLVALVIAGAWLLFAFGVVFEAIGRVR